MKKKTKKAVFIILGIIILIVFLIGGLYLYKTYSQSKNFLEINGYYDSNGNPINTESLSVVNGIQGVKYITLGIYPKNLYTVPLTFSVLSMTPSEILSTKPLDKITVNPGETGNLITGLIDITLYEEKTQEFCVTVISDEIPSSRLPGNASGCTSVKFEKDPTGQFTVTIEDNIGSGNVNPGCTENWQCSNYGDCISGMQTRTCNDLNNCGTTLSKPEEEQICNNPTFETNAVGGNYKVSGVWIKVNGMIYNYNGYSSYACLIENTFLTTPEGNSICSRPGYDISSRVYIRYGNYGLVFIT